MTLNQLCVASECAPVIKTGSLADVVGALGPVMSAHDVACRVLLLLQRQIGHLTAGAEEVMNAGSLFGGPVRVLAKRERGIGLLLVEAPHLYDRPGQIYLNESGLDWADNHLRCGLLSWLGAEIGRIGAVGWTPQVIHAHDWQAGLVLAYSKQNGSTFSCAMTIQNIAFQGTFPANMMGALGLDPGGYTQDGFEYFGQLSFLKGGLMLADKITTVSPTYARELMTPKFGMGLEGVLAARKTDLTGILNGIDTVVWNPATDPVIAQTYTSRTLAKKGVNIVTLVAGDHARLGAVFDGEGVNFAVFSENATNIELCLFSANGERGRALGLARPHWFVLDSLRYWVAAMWLDGFRFYLATTLGREPHDFDLGGGFFDAIRQDLVLSRCKLIAEPWDIGPVGYQLGGFSADWAEWNDRFRDTARKFWRGDAHAGQALAGSFRGTVSVFDRSGHKPFSSVNFVAAHDGFTLADVTRYLGKHKEANGQSNADGHGHNLSDNCGVEGDTADPAIVDYPSALKNNAIALAEQFAAFCALPEDAPEKHEFRTFCVQGGESLHEFALIEALSTKMGADWLTLSAPYRNHEPAALAAFAADYDYEIIRSKWAQWQAEPQLAAAQIKALAGGMRVGLYLDRAVGPRLGGAETWGSHTTRVTGATLGAPPDLLEPSGQSWGLAPLSPLKCRATGFEGFLRLLRSIMCHAGMIRIDNILGMMRSFWIPEGSVEGTYVSYPFKALLAVVASESVRNNSIVVGEDLGFVPEGLRDAIATSGIYGLDVLQYMRTPSGGFVDTSDTRENAVCTFDTHDTPSVAGFFLAEEAWVRHEFGGIDADTLDQTRADRMRAESTLYTPEPIAQIHRNLARANASKVAIQLDDLAARIPRQKLPGTVDSYPNRQLKALFTIGDIGTSVAFTQIAKDMAAQGRSNLKGMEKEHDLSDYTDSAH